MGLLTDALKVRARGGPIGVLLALFCFFGLAAMITGIFTPVARLLFEGPAAVWSAIAETARAWPAAMIVFSVGLLGVLILTLVIVLTTLASGAAPKLQFLWLRRFYTEFPPRYPVSRLLEELNFAGAHGWTLRDSRVMLSGKAVADAFARAAGENGIALALVLTFWFFVAIASAVTSITAENFEVSGSLRPIALVAIGTVGIAAAIVSFLAGIAGMAGASRVELTGDSLFNRIVARYHKLAHRANARSAGITIFATPDELWKQAIQLILERVDFILLDATDMSDNIAYELETIRDQKRTRMLLVMAAGDRENADISADARATLTKYFGDEWVKSAPIFSYPKNGRLLKQDRARLAEFIDRFVTLNSG